MGVAYIWSAELQAAADALPANVGRSARVHALIWALGLVSVGEGEGWEGGEGKERSEKEEDGQENEKNNDGGNAGNGAGNGAEEVCEADADRVETGNNAGEEASTTRDGVCETRDTTSGQATNSLEPPPFPPTAPPDTRLPTATLLAPDRTLATPAELRRYHDARYVDYLLRGGVSTDSDPGSDSDSDSDSGDEARRKRRKLASRGLEYDCPPFAQLGPYALLVAAGTLTAARALLSGYSAAIAWDGGRHHALRSKASGFCYVADAVLGILWLTRNGVPCPRPWGESSANGPGLGPGPALSAASDSPTPGHNPTRRPRILYLDMDLHYGDGVAQAFASPSRFPYPLRGRPRPPQVLTLSVHHAAPIFFPPGAPSTSAGDTPHPFSLSYALAAYPHCATYARAWGAVERVAAAWAPDYVVLQLGVDGLPRDPVGAYGAWSVSGTGSVPWVVERVMRWDRPTLVLGGGGYVNDNAARAWALATGAVLGRELRPEDDVPDHEFFDEYAPGYTLEVPESHVPDENTAEALDAADVSFAVLADRIREIVALQG